MDDVRVLLERFNESLKVEDTIDMIECIAEMKKLSPEFVDLMINAMYEDEDDEE